MDLKYIDINTELEDDKVKVVMTKEVEDRDGEVVLVDGINLKNFKKNPIVLWGHRSFGGDVEDVMGRADNISKEKGEDGVKALTAEIVFAEHPKAQYLKQMVKQGIITSLSIGFDVPEGGYDAKNRIIEKSELYELSFVNLPANPEARVFEVVKGMKLEKDEEEKLWKRLASVEANKSILKQFRELFLGKELCEKFGYEKTGDEMLDIKNIYDRLLEKQEVSEDDETEEPVENQQEEVENQPETEESESEIEVLSKEELKQLFNIE